MRGDLVLSAASEGESASKKGEEAVTGPLEYRWEEFRREESKSSVTRYLEDLSEEGWQVVGLTESDQRDRFTLLLARPVAA